MINEQNIKQWVRDTITRMREEMRDIPIQEQERVLSDYNLIIIGAYEMLQLSDSPDSIKGVLYGAIEMNKAEISLLEQRLKYELLLLPTGDSLS